MPYIDALSAIEDLGEGHTWFKLAFDVSDVEVEGQILRFKAMADSPFGLIGFAAAIPLIGWSSQELVEDLTVDWGHILLESVGVPTDTLLRVLEQHFGCAQSSTCAASKLSCRAVLLADDPAEMQTAEMHVKLFFDSFAEVDPESYAELYFNFDLPARRAFLMEKDQGYRAPLVNWWAGKYRPDRESVH